MIRTNWIFWDNTGWCNLVCTRYHLHQIGLGDAATWNCIENNSFMATLGQNIFSFLCQFPAFVWCLFGSQKLAIGFDTLQCADDFFDGQHQIRAPNPTYRLDHFHRRISKSVPSVRAAWFLLGFKCVFVQFSANRCKRTRKQHVVESGKRTAALTVAMTFAGINEIHSSNRQRHLRNSLQLSTIPMVSWSTYCFSSIFNDSWELWRRYSFLEWKEIEVLST